MSQDEFAKLFNYMEKRFDKIEVDLAAKANADEMNRRFDGIAAAIDDQSTEYAAITVQLDRHERWHHEVADHVGLTLQHDA
ncbi:hypothetical protein ACIBCN_19985 [Nocardia sp. NPDC051052]|uniref:hypothetical protein n=1 Tax=Nocardia sp. NPDC051052 TaxID=3364322 RepID=UPI00378D4F5C